MNNLSWFLYFADILENVSTTIIVFSTLTFLVATFAITIGLSEQRSVIKPGVQTVIGATLACFICAFIPSKNTMYAIAASELGESAIKSETGKKVEQALLNWIETQLNTKNPSSADK